MTLRDEAEIENELIESKALFKEFESDNVPATKGRGINPNFILYIGVTEGLRKKIQALEWVLGCDQ
jgi:hypothetical protein